LIVATLIACWLGMQAVHELGHVLGAWLVGAQVERVVLHPLTISRTDVAEHTSPLLVVWAGPIVGVFAPVMLWLVAAALKLSGAFALRFFAGFCLIANGAYIGLGSFAQIGDCGELIRHGAPPYTLWLFGLAALPLGLLLWNGQGRYFGLGPNAEQIELSVLVTTIAMAIGLIILGLAIGK
jgi:hypothetical protein